MSKHKKIVYTDEPIGKIKIIKDFLPTPQELASKDDTVKITLALTRSTVEYFKKIAKAHDTQYQKMIRRLLDEYTTKHSINK